MRRTLGAMLAMIKTSDGGRASSYDLLAVTFPTAEICRREYVRGEIDRIIESMDK